MTQSTTFRLTKRYTLWLLAAFFFALSYFAASNLMQKLQERNDARLILSWTETSVIFNQLVHELQKERGLSSGLLTTRGERFADKLAEQRGLTDLAIDRLEAAARTEEHSGPLMVAIEQVIPDRKQLIGLRTAISDLRISRDAAVDRYTTHIDQLFEQLLGAMSIGRVGWIYRQQMAFVFFLQAKEMAGQERALITAILSAGDFSPVRMAGFQRIRSTEDARIEKFLQLSEKPMQAGYQQIVSQKAVHEANRIRRLVIAVGANQTAPQIRLPSAENWFALATEKIEAMNRFEDTLTQQLLRSARVLEKEAQRDLIASALTVMVSFILAIFLLFEIRRGNEAIEKNLHLAATVFKSSAESIFIADAEARIIEVNRAFTQTFGYEREEVIGQQPRLLKSGRHDALFYQKMWEQLLRTDSWEGEIWNRRKNGSIFPALLSIVAVKNTKGKTENYIATTVDLEQYKQAEALIDQLRTVDPLTGLANHIAWISALERAIADARSNQRGFSVLKVGLDRFKLINDSFSHAIGDQILVKAANRIKSCLGPYDTLARMGGDRFAILLPEINDAQAASTLCQQLQTTFAHPVNIGEHTLPVSISIGVAIYPNDGVDANLLRKNVELAMYSAKEEGGGGYRFYAADMNAQGAQMLTMERLLRQALEQKELSVVYQPQILAADGRLIGVEALLRWKNPELGTVSPVQFIPIAEDTGLIVPIGEWVLREACQQAKIWQELLDIELPVAVNLSARQFRNKELSTVVRSSLEAYGLPSRLLELEITEGLLMHDPVGSKIILDDFRAIGVRIALDDFGTGYSSLAYLKNFPIDCLKIDRAFVKDLPENKDDKAISRAIIALGKNLGMQVLAEGVETQEQADFLAGEGCQIFQGFFYGKPMPGAELTDKIRSGQYRI